LAKGQFLASVTSFDYPVQRALVRSGNNLFNFLDPSNSQKRSQDLPETFHDAAQFYWATSNSWASAENVFLNARGIYIDRNEIQDIDTLEDFQRAETLMKFRRQ
jgi:N-acylneuraminate cytidylyltransferase